MSNAASVITSINIANLLIGSSTMKVLPSPRVKQTPNISSGCIIKGAQTVAGNNGCSNAALHSLIYEEEGC